MDTVGVEDAFSFLKQRDDERMRIERRLKRKLQAALAEFEASTAAAIARGEEPDYDALFEALRAAVGPDIAAITTDEAMRLAADVGIVFDPAVINTDAVRWARDYSYELVRGITDTTRTLVSEATATFVETPGMTIGDLTRMLDPAFGAVRAEMIAVTETTRAFSAATGVAQAQLNTTGIQMRRRWNTRNDEVVCFPAWTMVDTATGPRPIQSIKPGEWVCTRAGHRRVVEVSKRGYSGRMVRVETDKQVVTSTIDHPYWTLEQEWLEGRHIKVGHTLEVGNNHAAKVRRVVHFALGDAANLPVALLKVAGLAGVAGLVLMPVFAVNFQGNTGGRNEEVDRVAAHLGFLDVFNAEGVKHLADALLKQGFALVDAVARKAAELTVGVTGHNTESFTAVAAGDMRRWAAAFFGAETRRPARFTGLELVTTSLTGVGGEQCDTAFPATVVEAVSNTGLNLKGAPAGRADLRDESGTLSGIIASLGAIATALRNLSFGLVRLFATGRAGDHTPRFGEGVVAGIRAEGVRTPRWAVSLKRYAALVADKLKGHSIHLLTELALLYHRMSGTSIQVYNLQVEGAQEFYANGILVHNCEICGPLNGLPEGEWIGMFGDGPPAHPNCRCGLSLTGEDDETVIPNAIERAQTRLAMLRELGKEKEAQAQEARIEELRGRLYGAGPVSREARPLSLTEQRTQADIDEIKPLVDELIAAGDPTGGGMKGYLDSLQETMREERDINEALWNTMQKTPGQATDAEWTVTADRLQAEGYELYRKYTKEGIAVEVAEQRGAQVSGYMVVGKEQVLVRQGAFSVRTATRMQGELWAEAKTEMTSAIGEMLQRAGFGASDIAQANYEQRLRLLEELGQKELLTTRSGRPSRIDAVPEDARARVVDLVDFDLAAQCANSAIDPLALPTLDAYGKMELADRIRNTRLSGGGQGYISELNF